VSVGQSIVEGRQSALNLSVATVVKPAPGRVARVIVTTAGAAGSLYDASTQAGALPANLIAAVPATLGPIVLNWPCLAGILYVPGAAQVASISYE
jgi:hypothetical protein